MVLYKPTISNCSQHKRNKLFGEYCTHQKKKVWARLVFISYLTQIFEYSRFDKVYMCTTTIIVILFDCFCTENPFSTIYTFTFWKMNGTTTCLVFAFLHVETTNALYNINKMPNNLAFICKRYYIQGVEMKDDRII